MRFPYSGNGTWTPDYHCGFIDAVKRFFIGYMEFRGRSSRREFWLAMLFFIPVSVLIFLIPAAGTGVRNTVDAGHHGTDHGHLLQKAA